MLRSMDPACFDFPSEFMGWKSRCSQTDQTCLIKQCLIKLIWCLIKLILGKRHRKKSLIKQNWWIWRCLIKQIWQKIWSSGSSFNLLIETHLSVCAWRHPLIKWKCIMLKTDADLHHASPQFEDNFTSVATLSIWLIFISFNSQLTSTRVK